MKPITMSKPIYDCEKELDECQKCLKKAKESIVVQRDYGCGCAVVSPSLIKAVAKNTKAVLAHLALMKEAEYEGKLRERILLSMKNRINGYDVEDLLHGAVMTPLCTIRMPTSEGRTHDLQLYKCHPNIVGLYERIFAPWLKQGWKVYWDKSCDGLTVCADGVGKCEKCDNYRALVDKECPTCAQRSEYRYRTMIELQYRGEEDKDVIDASAQIEDMFLTNVTNAPKPKK
jgi:hypothetical protein